MDNGQPDETQEFSGVFTKALAAVATPAVIATHPALNDAYAGRRNVTTEELCQFPRERELYRPQVAAYFSALCESHAALQKALEIVTSRLETITDVVQTEARAALACAKELGK